VRYPILEVVGRAVLTQVDPTSGNLLTFDGRGTHWHEYAEVEPGFVEEVNIWHAEAEGNDATIDDVRDHMNRVMGERAVEEPVDEIPETPGYAGVDGDGHPLYEYGDGPEPFAGANEAAHRPHRFVPWAVAPSLCAECALYPEASCHVEDR
jgi:hypothetical protein